ncbi:hypothetical protein QYE76_014048 [Lolium multiflorum]|uniref:Retrotransposon gag domain-containing protein n=1 Tax=Lolium multiflorum TaxID=4521 RepID=A0AAD8X5G5_LOLMU|nr:hypothetical protein QYE76_014048 [Lolium multiflorum]
MTWADFKLKFSKYHVPPGLIKKMRDEFRELKQGRDRGRIPRQVPHPVKVRPDETDTTRRGRRGSERMHDEMQTVLVNIPFADLEALVDSAIQMEGKLNQANENRKRRMMHESGPSNTSKFRPSSSGGFTPRNNRPPAQMSSGYRTGAEETQTGGHHHNNNNFVHTQQLQPRPDKSPANPNTNTAPRTGSNAIPVAPKDKSTINAMSVAWWGTTPKSVPETRQDGRQHHWPCSAATSSEVRRSPRKLCFDWSLPERHRRTRSFLIDASPRTLRVLQRPGMSSDPLGAVSSPESRRGRRRSQAVDRLQIRPDLIVPRALRAADRWPPPRQAAHSHPRLAGLRSVFKSSFGPVEFPPKPKIQINV